MPGKILTVTFPAATNKQALGLAAHMRSHPHGLGAWTTIAAGFVWRVEGGTGANITGNTFLQCGFRSSAAGLPGTNPGHSYFHNLYNNPWTWNGSGYWSGNAYALARYQNATYAALGGPSSRNSYGDDVATNYNAAIVAISKSSPTTTSGISTKVGTADAATLLATMQSAMDQGNITDANTTLGGSILNAGAYTVDEATYGALDEVFAYWNNATRPADVLWTGVAKWA